MLYLDKMVFGINKDTFCVLLIIYILRNWLDACGRFCHGKPLLFRLLSVKE